ncbi:MAG: hypothetical protein JNM00_00080 [Flavobacteriales bacterium]|nr:hypothetical protein [Flavobacteriales bacterium]
MKRLSLLLVIITAGMELWAQLPSLWLLESDTLWPQQGVMLRFDAQGMAQSTDIDLAFGKKMLFGGRIGDDHIDKIYNRINNFSYGAAGLTGSLAVYSFGDSLFNRPELGLVIRAGHVYDMHWSMRKGLFDLVFRGNAHHRGETVDAGMYFQQTVFQKFGVGLFSKNSMNEVVLNYVNGQSFDRFNAEHLEITTSAGGDSLTFGYAGNIMRSDTSVRGFAVSEGQGLALDFSFNIGNISLTVQNLGAIRWNDGFERYDYDSVFTWRGVELTDLVSLTGDSLGWESLQDSLQVVPVRKARWMPLPAMAEIRVVSLLNKYVATDVGLRLRYNLVSFPEVFASVGIMPWPHQMVSLRATGGGYGRARLGFEYQWKHHKGLMLRAGTDNFPGIISNHARGASLYLTFAHMF